MEELEVLVTPQQLEIFEEGELARKAVKIVGAAVDDVAYVPSMSEFTTVRDYLMAGIALSNGHRSGVLANITMEEFERATLDEKAEKWLLGVKNHKTYRKYGPAIICMTQTKYDMLKTYTTLIRPHFANSCEQVFLSWRGKRLESGAVSKQINSIWKRSGIYGENNPPKKKLCTTVIQKSVTSLVHDQYKEKAQPVTDLLAHSLTTAGKSYRLRDRQRQAVVGTEAISTIMNNPIEKGKNIEWNCEDEEFLRELFEEELKSREISIVNVREKFVHVQSSLPNRSEKQIIDKLRSMILHENTNMNLPTDEPETYKQRVARLVGDSPNGTDDLEYVPNCDDLTDSESVIPQQKVQRVDMRNFLTPKK